MRLAPVKTPKHVEGIHVQLYFGYHTTLPPSKPRVCTPKRLHMRRLKNLSLYSAGGVSMEYIRYTLHWVGGVGGTRCPSYTARFALADLFSPTKHGLNTHQRKLIHRYTNNTAHRSTLAADPQNPRPLPLPHTHLHSQRGDIYGGGRTKGSPVLL